jgi:hypothetical protein
MISDLEESTSAEIEDKDKIRTATLTIDNIYPNSITPRRVVYENESIGHIDYYHPLLGRCLKCASKDIASLRHIESNSGGSSIIVCGGCGERGVIEFHKRRSEEDFQYFDNISQFEPTPNYIVFGSSQRGYDCTIRNNEDIHIVEEKVVVGGLQTIMTLDWSPVVWQKRESLRPGIYMFDIDERTLEELKNPKYFE